jgi:hypothetical protein
MFSSRAAEKLVQIFSVVPAPVAHQSSPATVMAAQKAQADVLLHRLHYALPGGGTPRRRGAPTRKTSSTAQPMQGRGLAATSMRTTALLSTAWAARSIRAGRAASSGGAEAAAAVCTPLLCISLLHTHTQKKRSLDRAKWSFACGRVGHPLTEGRRAVAGLRLAGCFR